MTFDPLKELGRKVMRVDYMLGASRLRQLLREGGFSQGQRLALGQADLLQHNVSVKEFASLCTFVSLNFSDVFRLWDRIATICLSSFNRTWQMELLTDENVDLVVGR